MSVELNKTEIQELLRDLNGMNAYREAPPAQLEDALDGLGEAPPCPLEPQREAMEAHIKEYYRRLRTQLPGCDGRCTSFGCPNLIVVRCWESLKGHIL
jgi:hypothetical protein